MFEELGFFKEFYINGKLIGICNCEKDREILGYLGRKKETFYSEIILTNKKKIKTNIEYTTIVYPLNGKISHK